MIINQVKTKIVQLKLHGCKIKLAAIKPGREDRLDMDMQAKVLNGGLLSNLMQIVDLSQFKPLAKNYEGIAVDISALSNKQIVAGVSKGDFVLDGFMNIEQNKDKAAEFYSRVKDTFYAASEVAKTDGHLKDLQFIAN